MSDATVTVPVERAEYERLISVTEDLIREVSDPGTEALAAVYCARRILDQSAMLSAAPAPEGGAANDDRLTYRRLARALSCHPTVMVVERSDPTLELTAKSLEDTLEEVLPLATREDAQPVARVSADDMTTGPAQ